MNTKFERLPDVEIQPGQKVFFASDFHLGAPNKEESLRRERLIVKWLQEIAPEAAHIFLLGDLFDYWYEYRHVIPKGFARFQGELARLSDAGIPLSIFTGNHDMWAKNYFTEEMGIPVYRRPRRLQIGGKEFLIAHGDGLGPGDRLYKFLKFFFENPLCRRMFEQIHPGLTFAFAHFWSASRRGEDRAGETQKFLGENEWLWSYAREQFARQAFDFSIFGHRHLPLSLPVGQNSRYFNLGEWINYFTFGEFEGEKFHIKTYRDGRIQAFSPSGLAENQTEGAKKQGQA